MWIVLIINLLVAIALAYLGFKQRGVIFNWFTASSVFIVFGLILLVSAIPAFNDFNVSSLLMFIGGLLIIIGIIALIIGFTTKAVKIVNLQDIAITMEIAAVCVICFVHDLSLINVIVPELAAIIGIILFLVSRRKVK